MVKIILINKETIKQMTGIEKEKMSKDILINIFKNIDSYTEQEIKKLFKNIYNLGQYRKLQSLDGKVFQIQSTGMLKEIKNG